MEHLAIPANHRLSPTDTNIFGFNATRSRPIGKIKLKCQFGDLKSEVTCYVIDANTSYNLLLGRPWIHRNRVVPSTLHQVMKYVDAEDLVRALIVEQHPFKGVEKYFTDSLLYKDVHESAIPEEDEFETWNEADQDPDSGSDNKWELDHTTLETLETNDKSIQPLQLKTSQIRSVLGNLMTRY